MNRHLPQQQLPAAKLVAERVLSTLERFLRVEAVSGVVLLAATLAALVWANSSHFVGYQAFWHTPVEFRFGGVLISQPLDFWINDSLMTIFFLVVGLEIRREMHEGALATPRAAAPPAAAALGGVVVPALIYLAVATDTAVRAGWAVPTATDIAFAVGILALLGRSIPPAVRVLLLALAVIDDIAAVIIIAAFYSGGFDTVGLPVAASGVLAVLMLQWLGVRSALLYVAPGAVLWFGLLRAGVHPTLAGVILGLLTPATPVRQREATADTLSRALADFRQRARVGSEDVHELASPIRQLRDAERDLLSPAARVQMALHPWVAYGVMPLFALANAGVHFGDINFDDRSAVTAAAGVFLALVIGKPLGILAMSWAAVRAGWCRLPDGITWRDVLLVGLLGGIGFTMAIFIATLAFPADELLGAAKFGVMTGSALAAILGLTLGYLTVRGRAAGGETARALTIEER